jgi:two-component system, HptB-dependent secretion and biofilm response regulator
MKILLVEDNAADAAAIATILMQLRHAVFTTQNGNDALDYYVRHRPDLVITAPFIPGIDGFSLTQEILRHAAPRWLPVVFLLAEPDESLQARASEVGADACFLKPLTASTVAPRLAAIGHLLGVQEDAELRVAGLRRQLEAEQADLQQARHLIEYQMTPAGGYPYEDPAVQQWRNVSSAGSNDMTLLGRTPGGRLHLLLADAAGSGLSACVCLQPLIAPFQRMTQRGCTLPVLVRELNRKLRQTLPAGHFVAAQLVSLDPREKFVSVWNGGMPPAFVLDGAGHHFREFPLLHPALGALDDADFDDRVDQHAFGPDEQIVMVSDGLLDAIGANGMRFGEDGLAAVLVGLPRCERKAEIAAAISTHLSGTLPADDMTLVLLDCEQAMPLLDVPPPAVPCENLSGNWCSALRLDAAALRQVEVVPLLLGMIERFPSARVCSDELFVVLSELFDNALDHGLLRLDSRLRGSSEGVETWLMMREERLAALEDGAGEIRLWVEQVAEEGSVWLRIRCQDSGPGFVLDATPSSSSQERGLARVRKLAHFAEIVAQGSEVRVLLRLADGTANVQSR